MATPNQAKMASTYLTERRCMTWSEAKNYLTSSSSCTSDAHATTCCALWPASFEPTEPNTYPRRVVATFHMLQQCHLPRHSYGAELMLPLAPQLQGISFASSDELFTDFVGMM